MPTGSSCSARAASWPTGRPRRSGTCRVVDRSGRAWRVPTRRRLSALPGVRTVEIRGDRVLIQTMDSDAVARYLLTATAARDVEIAAHNLEDAFLALTSDESRGGHESRADAGAA